MDYKTIFNGVLSDLTREEHITDVVLSGGAYYMLAELGVIKEYMVSKTKPLLEPTKLKNIYGTSAGSILGVLITLGVSIEDIMEYMIHRPWAELFEFNPQKLFTFHRMRSLFNTDETIVEMMRPFFEAQDANIKTLTMREMYEKTGKTTYIYTTSMYGFKLMEISYKTHPDLLVADAVSMSCGIPLIFEPKKYDGHYYMDGGTCMNYPLEPCLRRVKIKTRILGLKINYNSVGCIGEVLEEEPEINTMWESLFVFFSQSMSKTFSSFDKEYDYSKLYVSNLSHIKEYVINTKPESHMNYLSKLIYSAEERENFVNYGIEIVKETNARTQLECHMTHEHHTEQSSLPVE
jgi:predicted acylesterase/phospholipase RssA